MMEQPTLPFPSGAETVTLDKLKEMLEAQLEEKTDPSVEVPFNPEEAVAEDFIEEGPATARPPVGILPPGIPEIMNAALGLLPEGFESVPLLLYGGEVYMIVIRKGNDIRTLTITPSSLGEDRIHAQISGGPGYTYWKEGRLGLLQGLVCLLAEIQESLCDGE